MANDKQSLTNYETILWLWDASDEQRIMFLASLNPDQRSQFCDVLRDVLNNPWEGRSALKLTKLNKLLGQNVDRIKKQVQFSGDKTPELDEKQIFRLLHDYTVLNHDGTRRLTALGKQNLEQLLMTVDAEFETYYDRDASHPQLMWNGFQNDTLFPSDGMEKTQVEPTDYGELNDKITNYYFPVGGGPKPKPQDDEYDYHDEQQDRDDDELSPDSLTVMHLRYLPVFLCYALFAFHAGFFGVDSSWSILFGLITLFASVKWYNIFKFYDRGWASLLQGFWVLNYGFSLALASGGAHMFVFALAWPLVAFWCLAKKLHCKTPGQGKFILGWTIALGMLGLVCAFTFASRQHDAYVRHKNFIQRRQDQLLEEHRRKAREDEERIQAVEKSANEHIAQLRAREGGIGWDGLSNTDLKFLTPSEKETLRLQLTNAMRQRGGTMEALTLESILPSKRGGCFRVVMSLSEPMYAYMRDRSGFATVLGLNDFNSIELDTPAGQSFSGDISARYDFRIVNKDVQHDQSTLIYGHELQSRLRNKRYVYIQVDSQAESDLKKLAQIAGQLKSQIKADERVVRADPAAKGRIDQNTKKLRHLRELARSLYSAGEVITVIPTELKRIADFDDWGGIRGG